MLLLGEYAIDGFENHPYKNLCFALFLITTFFTQIIILNMLIAIMFNSLEKAIQNKT